MYGQELNLVAGMEVGVFTGHSYLIGTVEKVTPKGQATVRLSETRVHRFNKDGKIIGEKYLDNYRLYSAETARYNMEAKERKIKETRAVSELTELLNRHRGYGGMTAKALELVAALTAELSPKTEA